MRALLQRVAWAKVEVEGEVIGKIDKGIAILLGVHEEDSEAEANFLAQKIAKLRIFQDSEGKMNLSIADTGGAFLVVSQFTLYADARKGNRPSYVHAARPDKGTALYEYFQAALVKLGFKVASGRFGADMKVSLLNDGPVTIFLDTKELKS
ncbi:MAG: D-aminoacyl-tRNA deacylase [Deinococcales bacterium]